MIRYLVAAATALLLITGCSGGNPPPSPDKRVQLIHTKASSWTEEHTDQELSDLMDYLCEGGQVSQGPELTNHDYGYLIGLAMSTCGTNMQGRP